MVLRHVRKHSFFFAKCLHLFLQRGYKRSRWTCLGGTSGSTASRSLGNLFSCSSRSLGHFCTGSSRSLRSPCSETSWPALLLWCETHRIVDNSHCIITLVVSSVDPSFCITWSKDVVTMASAWYAIINYKTSDASHATFSFTISTVLTNTSITE